jgi:hypothetical protein
MLLLLFVFVEARAGLFLQGGCLFAVTVQICTFLCCSNVLKLKQNTKETGVDIVFTPAFP